MESIRPGIFPLRAHVQHYAWGDHHAIPVLRGQTPIENRPCAELWMGAHPDLPSEIRLEEDWHPLDALIAASPDAVLGPAVSATFQGKLPFLFKLLAAAEPLSIQVHPGLEAARLGFERENQAGVPMDARQRHYKDANHKPELIVALVPFYGLRGFRPLPEIRDCLGSMPEFEPFLTDFQEDIASLQALYERLMRLEDGEMHALLSPIIRRLAQRHQERPYTESDREYWLLRADACHAAGGKHDRGLISFFLLNLVRLEPGQAMYLPAGILHAYLAGFGVELMANSNNVLRGGLTSKHVDVDELLAHLRFDPGEVSILQSTPVDGNGRVRRYQTSAQEFELQCVESGEEPFSAVFRSEGPEILLPTQLSKAGSHGVRCGDRVWNLEQGRPLLICAGLEYRLDLAPDARLFKAIVPKQ